MPDLTTGISTPIVVAVHDDVQTFLRALFPTQIGFINTRALPSKTQRFLPVGDDAGVAAFLHAHAHENTYLGCATRRTTANGTLENCHELFVLWTDLDFKHLPESEARTRIGTFPIPPHIVVHSGGGLQCYWRLREPLLLPADATIAQSTLKRLALGLGGDLASTDPARVLRLPTSRNYKYDPPRTVRLERLDDDAVNLSELTEWLPAELKPPNGSHSEVAPFTVPPTIRDGARNDTLYRSARVLHTRGFSAVAIRAALHAENTEKGDPPLPAAEVDDIATHAASQIDRPDFLTIEADDIVLDAPETSEIRPGLDPAFLMDAIEVIQEGQHIAETGIRYTVDGIVPSYGTLGMLVAYAKVGKTTLGQALAAAVAMGRTFLERETTASRVLVIAAEDPPEYTAYLARVLCVDPARLTFYRAPLILNQHGLRAICHTVEAGAYGLVLIASWQAVIRGLVKDENDNAGAVHIMESVKAFTRTTRIPWLIDAHSGKGEDQADEADPSQAMRGASGAAGAADYTLWLRYANGAFGTQRRFSGKGRFVNFAPLTLDLDLTNGTYTLIGTTKRASTETTWKLIREMGALDHTPRSLTEIARRSGLVPDDARLGGNHRRQITNALTRRPGVLLSQEMRRGHTVTLYHWEDA